MGWREDIRAGARAIAAAGTSTADLIDEDTRNRLSAIMTKQGDVLAVMVQVHDLGPANQMVGGRVAVELAKAGFTGPQIYAALPVVFYTPNRHEHLQLTTALNRAELVASMVNTFALTPTELPMVQVLLRHIASLTGADL